MEFGESERVFLIEVFLDVLRGGNRWMVAWCPKYRSIVDFCCISKHVPYHEKCSREEGLELLGGLLSDF